MFDKTAILNKLQWEEYYHKFLGLEQKQRLIVVLVLCVLGMVLLFMPMSCVSSKLNEKQEEYQSYVVKASELYGLLDEYAELKKGFSSIERSMKRLGSDSLSTVIYKLAEDNGIRKNSISLKSMSVSSSDFFSEIGKQVTIKNIPFDQLVKLLHELETYPDLPLTVTKLTVKVNPRNKQSMRNVSFTLTTIKPST